MLMKIDAGEVAMSTESFTHLMNAYVFHYRGAPLTNISNSDRIPNLIQHLVYAAIQLRLVW
jgi:hypothetical protein